MIQCDTNGRRVHTDADADERAANVVMAEQQGSEGNHWEDKTEPMVPGAESLRIAVTVVWV